MKDCLQQIVEVADTYNCEWYTIGKRSKEGHPHHPIYLSKQSKMEKFDVREYLKSFYCKVKHMKKYPIEEKTVEELVAEANRILAAGVTEMTEEEEMEDDAEGGYFEDD